ncbi:HlyD family efflux transporter periplasmic adaptor subunit [Virgibacillus pantothenticus]|uniref:efflux RND transporter periplasmic adaptor subunit n=1 Tax=Virgibacillus pantothenticus TaxID=1473 RepID=UPI001C23CE5B|nr:HlyD family efflux transporter periplasmic adaptor subunit [Virgibacillus pantothenticus]MBU8566503.1 HlyD family efflux transporter periplasmic adaptor subunit [Virgibacillus pantothenticus]MBU8600082.1 HlyD family efflux transporter periplasmic adaptor subunit [Virgibacillus pantothenticus]MBU8633986.1 HlyD family efflux transporter periplasmic adaptor subunit [Virgibacillus pantothenticus]MBU8641979.1 HlyD family efflux transporter periplasmic adaptor subunit [Virgibacillus pantothenticus
MKRLVNIFLFIFMLALTGCSSSDNDANTYSGTVEGNKQFIQAETTTALVDSIHIDEGDHISKNDSLLTLDTEKLDLKIAEAKYAIEIAEAQKTEAEDSGREELIQQADGAVKQAKVKEELLSLEKERSNIKSPIKGRIQDVYISEGELANAGENLLSIIDPSIKEVIVYIAEKDLNKVEHNQTVELTTNAYSDKTFTGKVKNIATEAQFTPKNIQTEEETAKRVFAVTIDISAENELKPGMTVYVEL